jgi:MFS family permease
MLLSAGWQWLFIIEGVPSVLLGAAILTWLPSTPLTAWMLSTEERELLHKQVCLSSHKWQHQ